MTLIVTVARSDPGPKCWAVMTGDSTTFSVLNAAEKHSAPSTDIAILGKPKHLTTKVLFGGGGDSQVVAELYELLAAAVTAQDDLEACVEKLKVSAAQLWDEDVLRAHRLYSHSGRLWERGSLRDAASCSVILSGFFDDGGVGTFAVRFDDHGPSHPERATGGANMNVGNATVPYGVEEDVVFSVLKANLQDVGPLLAHGWTLAVGLQLNAHRLYLDRVSQDQSVVAITRDLDQFRSIELTVGDISDISELGVAATALSASC